MIAIDKSQIWQGLEQQFAKMTDEVGTPIDPVILATVVALNAQDIYTVASCQGHLNRENTNPYPWIVVSSKEAEDIGQKIAESLYDGRRESEVTKELARQHRHLLLHAEYGLVKQLEAFYQHQYFSFDRHLSIWRYSNGTPCLQSHGAEYQQFREPNERASKLKEYQEEMHAFAAFLKRRFFGEDEPEQEYTVAEAAAILSMKSDTLTHTIMNGKLTAELRGRNYYIKRPELERFKNTPRRAGRPRKER